MSPRIGPVFCFCYTVFCLCYTDLALKSHTTCFLTFNKCIGLWYLLCMRLSCFFFWFRIWGLRGGKSEGDDHNQFMPCRWGLCIIQIHAFGHSWRGYMCLVANPISFTLLFTMGKQRWTRWLVSIESLAFFLWLFEVKG